MKEQLFDEFINRGGVIQVYKMTNKESTEVNYEPIILYGKTGTGKTFLARKIEIEAYEKGLGVENVVATELAEALVEDIRKDFERFLIDEFINNHYKEIDMLIIEDMHEIKERISTQIMLAELVMKLARAKKQVLVLLTGNLEDISMFDEYLRTHN